ncbi:MAG: biotin/lipoyl-binding carrier protein [Gammaproteobacteria bacterium]|nr:biotin/lipoyl-binding carrier protein [Gammaproteobacteria bacterium]MCP5199673.1 biotin/lipoyl-binding carrier protein [Gammaproteobacteria bacterium]
MAAIEVRSEIPGNVWKVEVAVGDALSDGSVLVILESMKMEIPILAPCAGTVGQVAVQAEQFVAEGDLIAVIDT